MKKTTQSIKSCFVLPQNYTWAKGNNGYSVRDGRGNVTFGLRLAGLFTVLAFLGLAVGTSSSWAATVFVNEIHYDNAGTDTGEAIEIAGPAGTDLSGWEIVLYNGGDNGYYSTKALTGVIPDQMHGFGTMAFPFAGIQNGAPDGVALVAPGDMVVQFLSYEGALVAADGPAVGMTSRDIGVFQDGDPIGSSLQLSGVGQSYEDFYWEAGPASFDGINANQSFGAVPLPSAILLCGPGLLGLGLTRRCRRR